MVGVAGKSRACNTCRSRRVTCDYGRPSCLKCTRTNRQCGGYSRDTIFVNRTSADQQLTALSVISARRAQERLDRALNKPETPSTLHRLFAISQHEQQTFRDYAIKLLIRTYLPAEPEPISSLAQTNGGSFSWVYRLADLTAPSRSLDVAIHAFCLVQLYVIHTDGVVLDDCLAQYNNALQNLGTGLDDADQRIQEETLATILVLSTCEFFICPAESGFSAHLQGMTEILRLCDPATTNTPTWRHLLSRLRIIFILEALTKQNTKILRNEVWQQVVSEATLSGPLNDIFTIFSTVPHLLEQSTGLLSIRDSDRLVHEAGIAIQSMLDILQHLDVWFENFCSPSNKPRFWPVPSRATNPADQGEKIFPICFEFESLGAATPLSMYWSVAAQLCCKIVQIYDLVHSQSTIPIVPQPRHTTLAGRIHEHCTVLMQIIDEQNTSSKRLFADVSFIEEIRQKGEKMARSVCQSLEYCHRIEMGTYGGQATTFPTWSARQYFRLQPGYEREYAWLQNKNSMQGPGMRWGLSMMMFRDIPPLVNNAEYAVSIAN